MYPKPVQNLIELLTKLPGIGPRQAARFAFFILKSNGTYLDDLAKSLSVLREQILFCGQCFKSMEKNSAGICTLCTDKKRNPELVAVVEKESDLHNLEKTGMYHGLYHVLGGTLSTLDQDSPKKIRLKELYARVKSVLTDKAACEVILATNPTAEGDTTALYIERILLPLGEEFSNLKISRLGRGLSLGSELEHVDEVTLRSALTNRK